MKKITFSFLILISIHSIHAAPATWPNGENAQWLFSTYLQNIANSSCSATGVIIGFSSTQDSNFLRARCGWIGSILGWFFGAYNTTHPSEALVGFNATTGIPIYRQIWWNISGGNISYTGWNVGIGTASPQVGLDITDSDTTILVTQIRNASASPSAQSRLRLLTPSAGSTADHLVA